jgi:heat shock protein HslJ
MLRPAATLAIRIVFILFISASCTVATTEPIGEPTAITETYWLLYSIKNEEIQATEGTATSFIRFNTNNQNVKGFAGCNRFTGEYELKGSALKISKLAATRMMCPHMELENYVLKALENVSSYKIAGNVLTLYQDDNAVATFRAGSAEEMSEEE